MAILYKANETQFNHLGLGPLNDAISILVTEERNGIFELEMKYPVSGKLFKELKNDRIIKADAGHKLKDQRFKIIRITKPLKGIVTVYAEHVSYLTQDLALKPKVSFNGNARQALEHWKANLVDDNPFTVWSDITTVGSINWTIDEVENARRALGGVQGSILDVYGGEYLFDNYDIYLYQKRGVNSELLIAYGRNLVDLEQEEEIANTYTSIYPYSIYTDDDGNERMVTLPEYYIDSEHVDKYARRKILVVDFTNDEIKTVSALRNAARRYIIDNDVGVPRVNLKIQYIDLAKTLDYKDLALYEEVNLCDNVMIYFEKYDINTTAKVIKVVWDVLNERYDSIEVGEARASLSQAIDTVVDGKVHNVEKLAMQTLRTADGKNTIYFGLEEPLATQYPLKKNDIWYRIVDGEFTRTYIYDGVVWQLVIDMDSQEAKEEARQAQERADEAVERANQATEDANTAIGQAQAGFDLAQENATQIDSLGLQIGNVEDGLTTISGTVDGLQTTVSDVQGNVANLTVISNAMQARLSDAEGNINTLTLTSQSMQSTISSLQTELDELEIGGRNYFLHELLMTLRNVEYGDDSKGRWYEFNNSTVPLTKEGIFEENTEYTLSFKFENSSESRTRLVVEYTDGTSDHVYSGPFTTPNNKTVSHVRITYASGSERRVRLYNPVFNKGNKATDWSPAPEDMATQTQITQLSDAINLRVAKGDVINQINLDTSGVLIGGDKILLDGNVTVTGQFKVGNANITSIDAGKITVGDLVGHSLVGGNVIGGYIEQQSRNRRLEMYNGIIDSFYNGQLAMRFGQYSMEFYNRADDPLGRIIPVAQTSDPDKKGLGLIVDGDILNIGFEKGGLYRAILRTDFAEHVTTLSGPYNNLNDGSMLRLFANRRAVSDGRFTSHDQPAIILDQSDTSNDIDIWYGGFGRRTNASVYFRHRTSDSTYSTKMRVAHDFVRIYDELRIGSENHTIRVVPYANSVHWRFNANNYIRQQDDGQVSFHAGGNRKAYISSGGNLGLEGDLLVPSAYNRTTSNAVNVHVFANTGRFARSTSAKKYKQEIRAETKNIDYERILDLEIFSWYDKGEVEQNGGITDGLKRYYGLIADDFEKLGLTEMVVYENGQIENYSDRAWALLIPNLRDARDDIETLKLKVQYLEQKIKMLEGNVK